MWSKEFLKKEMQSLVCDNDQFRQQVTDSFWALDDEGQALISDIACTMMKDNHSLLIAVGSLAMLKIGELIEQKAREQLEEQEASRQDGSGKKSDG